MQHTSAPTSPPNRPHGRAGRQLLAAWPIWLASTVGGALIGLAAFSLLPSWYEATAVLKIGQVDGKAVEAPVQAMERLRLDSFVEAVGLADEPPSETKQRLSTRVIRGAELIEVRYRERSREAAMAGVQKIATLLAQRHQEIAQPLIQRLDAELQRVAGMQADSRQRRDQLANELRSSVRGPVKDEYPYLQLAFVGQDQELAEWEAKLRTARSAPNTEPTRLIEAVSASERPVSPRRSLIGVGALAGLLLGLGWSWLRMRPQSGAHA